MMPVPFSQVLEFLDWITKRHNQVTAEGLDAGLLFEMAKEYLQSGVRKESLTELLGTGREGEIDSRHLLAILLKVFQTCPMVTEAHVFEQMEHFAKCGRCFSYIERERLYPSRAELHPFLEKFLSFAEETGLTQQIKRVATQARERRMGRSEEIFGYLIQELGQELLIVFTQYVRDVTTASFARDYEIQRGQLMKNTREDALSNLANARGRLRGNDETQKLGGISGTNEDVQTEARRLAESVRILVEGDFYQEQVRHNPQIRLLLPLAGVLSVNAAQAIEFLLWLQEKHPKLDILASAPIRQIQELVTVFCEEKKYQNAASFTKDVMKWLRGEGERGILQRLRDASAQIRHKNKTYRSTVSPFSRYQTIPYHAMFLFLSAGDFPAFIRKYWEDLNCLTGDYLDVYYSYEDIERKVSAFEILSDFRSLQVPPTLLPAMLVWKKTLSTGGIIPLQKLSHEDVFDLAKLVVQRIVEGKDVQEICDEGRSFVQEKTEALSPVAKIIIEKGEVTMGDKIVTGDNINIGGVQNIGKFHGIVVSLNTAGQTEFANALSELRQAIIVSPHLTDSQKLEQGEVINIIGEEAAKSKPNTTILKMLGDGLMATLKTIPDLAKAATALAPLLGKLIS